MSTIVELIEGGGFRVRAYVADYDDVPLTLLMVDTITWATYDQDDGSLIDSGEFTPADVVLEDVVAWPYDGVGYNCRFVVPGSAIPDGGTMVQVKIKISLVDWPDAPIYVGKGVLPLVRVTDALGE